MTKSIPKVQRGMPPLFVKGTTITFDATNLLGSEYKDRFGPTPMFNRDVRNYDRTYSVGARFHF